MHELSMTSLTSTTHESSNLQVGDQFSNLTWHRSTCVLIRLESLVLKRLALHDLVHKRSQAVVPFTHAGHDCIDLRAVGRRRGGACSVGHQFGRQRSGKLVL